MRTFSGVALAVIVIGASAGGVFAQLPGEAKRPQSYDPVGDMRYPLDRTAANETVREAQQVLHDTGYYRGPIDGVMTPATRRAVWSFQHAKGLRVSGSLDSQTVAELDLPAGGSASPPSFGSAPESSRSVDEFQAP